MKKLRYFLTAFLLTVAGVGAAATFNLFQPATGILKGNASTYVTTAAASSDVISLWSGTCNASTFLKGDGSCAAPTATGVTSVGLTMPSGFSVTGSPVTSSGTLAVSTTLNGPLRGNGSGLVTGNIALGSEVSGTLPVANGGTGVGTLTGIAKGNGTSAFTAAASSDVISLWSGTCDTTTFLRGDGSCQTVAAGATGANPTATIGLTAVNGSAGTFLRSDGAPALSQAIVPTWTGQHTFQSAVTELENAAPVLRVDETDATTDERNWLLRSTAGAFKISTATDASPGSASADAVAIERTGTTVDSIALTAASVTVNGSPIPRFVFGRVNAAGTLQAGSQGISSVGTPSTGRKVMNFSTAYTSTPSCTFSNQSAGISTPTQYILITTASADVYTFSGGSPQNTDFSIICMGF